MHGLLQYSLVARLGRYGILNQRAAEVTLPLAAKHNVGIMNMAAAREKLPDPQRLEETMADWKDRGLVAPDALEPSKPLDWLIGGEVDSVVSAGYKFGAEPEVISTVLTGTATIAHLEENAAALRGGMLPAEHSQRLRDLFGHIVEYA